MNCIVNEQGELLEILQEEKELQERQSLVPLSNFYDVLNLERYEKSIWDFEQQKWIGQGEQRPVVIPMPSEMDLLRNKITQQERTMEELMFVIIPDILGGGM